MDDPTPTIHPYSSSADNPTASSNLTTILHFLVPPYFLKWGTARGGLYALASLTGLICHIIFIAYIIASIIRKGLDWLVDTAALPVPLSAVATSVIQGFASLADTINLPTGFVLSFISWWLVSSVWMAFLYKRHHDGTSGWRAYVFGGGWAWSWWRRGNSSPDSDPDFDFD